MNLEQKVDAIEGEVTLMKGEIKQTLVDLREFIMKQESPFVVGADGSGGPGISLADIKAMVDQAPTDAHSEAQTSLQSELDELRRENQRQIEDMQQRAAARPAAGQDATAELSREVEELRRESRQTQGVQGRASDAQPPGSQATIGGASQAQEPPSQHRAPAGTQRQPQVVRVQAPQGQAVPQLALKPQDQRQSLAPAVQQAPAGQPESEPSIEGRAISEPSDSVALDANLLASLLRWVGGVKRRLGLGQLAGFLEMYKLTGHLPHDIEKLILHMASLEVLPDESSDQLSTLDDVMDSLLQLHAIVYGPGHAFQGSLTSLWGEQSLPAEQAVPQELGPVPQKEPPKEEQSVEDAEGDG